MPQLSVSASRDAGGRIHLTLCNLHPRVEAEVRCDLHGGALQEVTGLALTAEAMNAHNTFADPDRVSPAEFTAASVQRGAIIACQPPMSVVAMTLLLA